MTRAHVGLGSNLGDRMAILDTAVRVLDADELTHVMAGRSAGARVPPTWTCCCTTGRRSTPRS